ncbi:hypothetical protein V5799_014738 [Amblyomma americanum]|uniref:Ran gtpase-activating protein n=1 Tax=Amblyomma americanum TaxID=6943 RepID=A0AAQ4E261_AMBAM
MSRPCTFSESGRDPCWVHYHRDSWNDVLVHYGPELLEASGGRTMSLRTLWLPGRAQLESLESLTSACLVLWLLYEHRCITSATLNAGVIAPHHVALFYRLLRFHGGYIGAGVQADHAEPAGVWRCRVFDALQCTSRLHTLHLSALRLNEPQSDSLCAVIARNPSLSVLVLRDVVVDMIAAVNLFNGLTFLKMLDELEFEATVDEEQGVYDEAVAILLHTTVRRLKLTLACGMTEFFGQLAANHRLQELELGHPVSDAQSFTALATSLVTNRVLSCLKISVRVDCERGYDDFCQALAEIVAKNRRLEVLDLSGTTFHGDRAIQALSDSLRQNCTLNEVHLHDSDLTCTDVLRLLDGLATNDTVREMCFGAVKDSPAARALVLKREEIKDLMTRATFVWTDDEIHNLSTRISRFSLRKFYLRGQDAWPEDVGQLLSLLPEFQRSLNTLYIEASGAITVEGADCLSTLFEESSVLRKVAVLYDTTQESSLALLEGLAGSTSITTFAFGRWYLGGMVSVAFRTALMRNKSLLQLDVHRFEGECVHPEFDARFEDAVATSTSLVAVRRFRDGREVRAQTLHSGMRSALRNNETALRHTLDVIVGKGLAAQAYYAYNKLRSCDSRGSYFSDCPASWPMCATLQEIYNTVRDPLQLFSLEFESLFDDDQERDLRAEFQHLYHECRRQIEGRLSSAV